MMVSELGLLKMQQADYPPSGYHNTAYHHQGQGDERWAMDPFEGQDYHGSPLPSPLHLTRSDCALGCSGYGMDYGDGTLEAGGVGGGSGGYFDPYGNPGAMVDLNPAGTAGGGSQEGSIHSGYSTPNQRRVMREIIV